MDSNNNLGARHAFDQRLAQAREIARAAGKIVAEEAMTWDVFRWTVIVLLVLNFILLVYVGTGSQVTAMHKYHDNYASDELDSLRAEVNEVAAELTAVRFGLRLPAPQMEPEPTTGSIGTPSIPLPTRSPRHH
jgi:hypothetical protein